MCFLYCVFCNVEYWEMIRDITCEYSRECVLGVSTVSEDIVYECRGCVCDSSGSVNEGEKGGSKHCVNEVSGLDM